MILFYIVYFFISLEDLMFFEIDIVRLLIIAPFLVFYSSMIVLIGFIPMFIGKSNRYIGNADYPFMIFHLLLENQNIYFFLSYCLIISIMLSRNYRIPLISVFFLSSLMCRI
jgi:hypothetical protein